MQTGTKVRGREGKLSGLLYFLYFNMKAFTCAGCMQIEELWRDLERSRGFVFYHLKITFHSINADLSRCKQWAYWYAYDSEIKPHSYVHIQHLFRQVPSYFSTFFLAFTLLSRRSRSVTVCVCHEQISCIFLPSLSICLFSCKLSLFLAVPFCFLKMWSKKKTKYINVMHNKGVHFAMFAILGISKHLL